MTRTHKNQTSLFDKLQAAAPMESAAADSAVRSVSLINEVIEKAALPQSQVADILGISPGRVSQVLNGDGNVRISTLAKFLRAAGFDLELSARKVPLNPPHESENPRFNYVTHKRVTYASDDGLRQGEVVELSESHPSTHLAVEYSSVRNVETGAHESVPAPTPQEPTLLRTTVTIEERPHADA